MRGYWINTTNTNSISTRQQPIIKSNVFWRTYWLPQNVEFKKIGSINNNDIMESENVIDIVCNTRLTDFWYANNSFDIKFMIDKAKIVTIRELKETNQVYMITSNSSLYQQFISYMINYWGGSIGSSTYKFNRHYQSSSNNSSPSSKTNVIINDIKTDPKWDDIGYKETYDINNSYMMPIRSSTFGWTFGVIKNKPNNNFSELTLNYKPEIYYFFSNNIAITNTTSSGFSAMKVDLSKIREE